MNYKFETHEAYQKWCEDMITKIYYAQIAMNNEAIKEVVHEIGMKLWITEGCKLIKVCEHKNKSFKRVRVNDEYDSHAVYENEFTCKDCAYSWRVRLL